MAMNRSPGGLDHKDYYYFKVFKLLQSEARLVLHYILCLDCKKDPIESFETYAEKQLNMNIETFKANFDENMRKAIRSDPSGKEFDVTLLCACIWNLCHTMKTKNKMGMIAPIRQFRNKIIHNTAEVESEAKMNDLIRTLRDHLVRALNLAKKVYGIPEGEIDDKIKQMDANIEAVKGVPLSETDIERYRKNIRDLKEANKSRVQDSGVPVLKERFKTLNIDPVSWMTKKDKLKVKMVYTRMNIVPKKNFVDKQHDKNGNKHLNDSIGHEDLLEEKTEDGESPIITLIEGEAGSGKSTLAKYILKDWADITPDNPNSTIKGLVNYQLVLHINCKDKQISNFAELVLTSIPHLRHEMDSNDILHSVLSLKTLVIIDGLDELRGNNSNNLLRELTDKYLRGSIGNLRFIITTRPTCMKRARSLCGKNPYVHMKLEGIPHERRVEFVEKMHEEMKKEGISSQSTGELIDFLQQSKSRLDEHFRLPLNLALLTYLWAMDSTTVNSVTSATSLYVAVLRLLKSRVSARIIENSEPVDELDDKIDKFVEKLFMVYLQTYIAGDMQISSNCVEKLKEECSDLKLPFADMVSEFFSVNAVWTPYDFCTEYSAPHKSIMEFFCASGIFNNVEADHQKHSTNAQVLQQHSAQQAKGTVSRKTKKGKMFTLTSLLSRLLMKKGDYSNDFAKHQNVLLHLVGLLALKNPEVLQEYSRELVNILRDAGVKKGQWMNLVAEAECNPHFTSAVAEQISEMLVVRDGHTLAALQIFEHLAPKIPVRVTFDTEVKDIPKIDMFLEKLSKRDCEIELLLKNHWKNPENGNSTQHLQQFVNKRCRVTRFTGNLENLTALTDDIDKLRLVIAEDSQAKQICDNISAVEGKLTKLGIHVKKSVSPASLKPLPGMKVKSQECGTLWISEVGDEDVSWACDIISALYPKGRQFNSILFPRCNLSVKGFQRLLEKLKEKGVKVSERGGVRTDSEKIDQGEVAVLKSFSTEQLKCEFRWGDEITVW